MKNRGTLEWWFTFGEFRLIYEYAKLGALWPTVKVGIICLVKRQSFKQIYPDILKKVEPMLVEKYGSQIPQIAQRIKANTNLPNNTNNKSSRIGEFENKPIWLCWLQGIENAPEIVHACYNSIKRNIPGREIKVIDAKNWKEYVELPEYIVQKWEKKRIPAALFSDILRLELLIKYGGLWMDSTVLCTDFKFQDAGFKWQEYLDADLFLFQYTEKGSIPVSISNWFITACKNNEILMVLRDILYAYWKDYDCTLDYYIFHLFFSVLSKEYPEEIMAMPYGQSMNSLVLLHHWGELFEQKKWDKLTEKVSFHKLAFRTSEYVKQNKDDYYHWIISKYKS